MRGYRKGEESRLYANLWRSAVVLCHYSYPFVMSVRTSVYIYLSASLSLCISFSVFLYIAMLTL